MADSFRAQFVLSLKDELSSGLRKIIADTKQLRDLAKQLGFKPMEGADAIVNRVDRDVSQLNRTLGATTKGAEAAANAIRRLSAAELGRMNAQAAQMRQSGALGRRIAGGATLDQLYGANGIPLMAGGPRFVPNQAGPSSRMGWRGRMSNAWTNTRERFGAVHEQIGLAGGAMAGISLAEPIRAAAEFENVLTHIAITAGATSDTVQAKVAEMAERYRAMALTVQQSSHDIAESAQFLITTGIGEEMTNRLLPIIAQAATAYNTPMRDAVQGAFSMHEELKIKPEDMQGALSAAALAAKQGHFSFSDISSFLPSVAAQAATTGISGREGLNSLLAALETSRRGAGTSGQAATNLQDFLSYINAPIGSKSFQKGGIDLPGLLRNAEKQGINPIEAVVERVRQLTARMSDAQSANTIGKLFHNQEARIFVETMLRELQYYEDTKKKIAQASDMTIDEDFKKAQNLHTQLVELTEKSAQLNQRLGDGFAWVVPVGSAMAGALLGSLQWMDKHLPGVGNGIIGLVGGMLGLVAVMGVLGTVAGPIKAGWLLLKPLFSNIFSLSTLRLLVSPWITLVMLAGAAAIDIWQHWDRFRFQFTMLWRDLEQMAGGFGEFLEGAFIGDNDMAVEGLKRIWDGFATSMRQLWGMDGILKKLFEDFGTWVDGWSGGLATRLGAGIIAGLDATTGVIEQSIKGWKKLLEDFKPGAPHLFMVPPDDYLKNPPQLKQGAPNGPDAGPASPPAPDPETHHKRIKLHTPLFYGHQGGLPRLRYPLPIGRPSFEGGHGHDPIQQVHITFEADVPGRTTVHQGDAAAQARGPMLSRA